MATANMSEFLRRLTRGMAAQTLSDHSDQQLVERALAGHEQAPFQAIVHRHGPMVYRVCWRVLQHHEDAEDAFQATFLILAQKLRTVRKHASLASWLHGVAHRVALKARARAAVRRRHEHQASPPDTLPPDNVPWGAMRSALDVELSQLPDNLRLPLILCYLEGRTQEESATQLGWSKSTLRRRLDEARDALGSRLIARGIPWTAAISAVLLADCLASAAPASALIAQTVEAAAGVAAGKTMAQVASATVAALAEGVLKTMYLTKLTTVTAAVFFLLFTAGIGLLAFASSEPPAAPAPQQEARDDAKPAKKVAVVPEGVRRQMEELDWLLTGIDPDKRTMNLDDRRDAAPGKAVTLVATPGTVGPTGFALSGLKVAPDAQVTLNGKDARLADLKPGQRIKVRIATDRLLVTAVEAQAPPPVFRYKLKAVDAKRRTLTVENQEKNLVMKDLPIAEQAELMRFVLMADKTVHLRDVAQTDLRVGMAVSLELAADEAAGLVVRGLTVAE
jgi:RNA polymerase sigma factor (sigma-70 family)